MNIIIEDEFEKAIIDLVNEIKADFLAGKISKSQLTVKTFMKASELESQNNLIMPFSMHLRFHDEVITRLFGSNIN